MSLPLDSGLTGLGKAASTTSVEKELAEIPAILNGFEGNQSVRPPKQWKGRRKPWLREMQNVMIAPFNMFAAFPDYDLEHQLSNHVDERIHNSLYKVLREAEAYRTACWRTAYWTVALSLTCTLGTAFIGIGGAVVSFSDNTTASKGLSILLAGFGVILSLLKGSGLPGTAFADYNNANDIIDRIEDVRMTRPPNWVEIENIKIAWRKIRDTGIERRGSIWSNSQMATLATGRIPKSNTAPATTPAPVPAPAPPSQPVLTSSPPPPMTSNPTSHPLTTSPNLNANPTTIGSALTVPSSTVPTVSAVPRVSPASTAAPTSTVAAVPTGPTPATELPASSDTPGNPKSAIK